MRYFYIEPEVAGGLGKSTVMDADKHPPVVKDLNYELDGWLGDAILESFPSFIVTEKAKDELLKIGVTGVEFKDVKITTSIIFNEMYPNVRLPVFLWMLPTGKAGIDDVSVEVDGRLVVSQRVLDSLAALNLENADVYPWISQDSS